MGQPTTSDSICKWYHLLTINFHQTLAFADTCHKFTSGTLPTRHIVSCPKFRSSCCQNSGAFVCTRHRKSMNFRFPELKWLPTFCVYTATCFLKTLTVPVKLATRKSTLYCIVLYCIAL